LDLKILEVFSNLWFYDKQINKSLFLLVYTCMSPFLILLSQLPPNTYFFLPASAVLPLAHSCQSKMWAPPPTISCLHVEAERHKVTWTSSWPSSPSKGWLCCLVWHVGNTDLHEPRLGGSTGNQSSVLQELAGLKGSPLECWATVPTSIKSILKVGNMIQLGMTVI